MLGRRVKGLIIRGKQAVLSRHVQRVAEIVAPIIVYLHDLWLLYQFIQGGYHQ